jgi:hypothetical protein
MEAGLDAMEAGLVAMEAGLAAMEARLVAMEARLAAMEAAQAGNACPGGFDENLFRVLCQQAADRADFQRRIDDQQKDIRDQHKDIRDQRRRIDDQRRRIDDQRSDQQKRVDNPQKDIRDQERLDDQQKDILERAEVMHEEHAEPAPQEVEGVVCTRFVLAPRRMWLTYLKLNDVRGKGIKNLIHGMAREAHVGGYVQRTGPRTFSVCGVSPQAEHCQQFITAVVESFGSGKVTLMDESPARNNEALAQMFRQGFKKVTNKTSQFPECSSMELTPDQDSDMVSLNVSSALWQ